jgi:hypothetical protein
MRLVESETIASYYVHVSPIKNLRSILAKGLLPNVGGGNYTGFETSLEGTYITRVPNIIHDHISARMIENGFVLVLVQILDDHGVIDEDVFHPYLVQCIDTVLAPRGLNYATATEALDPDDPVWRKVAALFATRLGKPNRQILKQNPGIVEDFVDTLIRSELYGEDAGDPDFWQDIKTKLVMIFPQVAHPDYGERYSLRIPGPIGYTGDTRIVAVIESRKGNDRVVKGDVPWAARALIDQVLN